MIRVKIAVFTGGLSENKRNEMLNYARCNHDFTGEYSDREKILDDAGERIVERRGKIFHVLNEGKFDCLLVYDYESLSKELLENLYEVFGIKVVSFRKEREIERTKKERPGDMEVLFRDKGKYKKVDLL